MGEPAQAGNGTDAPCIAGDVRKDRKMNEMKLDRHPLVFLAFVLAIVVFILPTHADLMLSASMAQRPATMVAVTAACFAVVRRGGIYREIGRNLPDDVAKVVQG